MLSPFLQESIPSAEAEAASSIEAEIEREKAELKKSAVLKNIGMGDLTCLVFMENKSSCNSVQVVSKLLEKERKGRYIQRIIPIEASSYANVEAFIGICKELFARTVEGMAATTFDIQYQSRFNSSITRQSVIDIVGSLMPVKHRVDLKEAKISIVVQVFKNIVGISIVEGYKSKKKLNMSN